MTGMKSLSDELLWEKASSGDVDAEEILAARYVYMVRACSRPYFLVGGDNEDLIQEGMMGLLAAIRRYDPSKDTKFRTFAEQCIRNRLITAVKSANRFKHSPLNDSLSIESPLFDESRTTVVPTYLRDPEELVITRERTDEITENFGEYLSKFENEILGFYLEGMSYAEIAEKTGKAVKSVDNAVQRIRRKLSRFL